MKLSLGLFKALSTVGPLACPLLSDRQHLNYQRVNLLLLMMIIVRSITRSEIK